MNTTVSVTEAHIANGTPGSGWGCALALAIEEAVPGCEVSVNEATAWLHLEDVEPVWVDLPAEACDFVEAYDNDWSVEPFTFTVDYPEVAQ